MSNVIDLSATKTILHITRNSHLMYLKFAQTKSDNIKITVLKDNSLSRETEIKKQRKRFK